MNLYKVVLYLEHDEESEDFAFIYVLADKESAARSMAVDYIMQTDKVTKGTAIYVDSIEYIASSEDYVVDPLLIQEK